MERVAGIQTGGSERAFDLYMKARYLRRAAPRPRRHLRHRHADQQHDGRDVHDAAVPRPRRACGAAASSTSTPGRPPSARSSTRWRSRPDGAIAAAPQPLRQVHEPARTPADVPGVRRRADGRDARPAAAAPGRRQAHRRRLPDVRRAARAPAASSSPATSGSARRRSTRGRTTPWPSPPTAASSPSTPGCSRPTAPDFPGSKINALVENVAAIWRADRGDARHADDLLRHGRATRRPGATRSTTRSSTKLVAARHPPRADRRHRRRRHRRQEAGPLREGPAAARSGCCIGSTQKMGTGTNVQKRLVALHHLDAPWKPAEVEQREGRILRQGNENEEVAIYRYVTEGSFDAYMWQALETKARFIAQVMTGESARPPGRGHRRPGALLRRGEGHRLGQPGRADARRGRRRAAAARRS